jgi:hypothetical protein
MKIRVNVAYPLYLEDAELSTTLGRSADSLKMDDLDSTNNSLDDLKSDDEDYSNELAAQELRRRGCTGKFVRIIITAKYVDTLSWRESFHNDFRDPDANGALFDLFKSIISINLSAQKISSGLNEESVIRGFLSMSYAVMFLGYYIRLSLL